MIPAKKDRPQERLLDELIDGLRHRHLRYNAMEWMERLGYRDLQELEEAVERTTSVFLTNQIPVEENIKVVYCEQDGIVYRDLRLSPLGFSLLVLNSDTKKGEVSRVQLEMLKRALRRYL